jgi:hypothetical protein
MDFPPSPYSSILPFPTSPRSFLLLQIFAVDPVHGDLLFLGFDAPTDHEFKHQLLPFSFYRLRNIPEKKSTLLWRAINIDLPDSYIIGALADNYLNDLEN